MIVIIWWLTSQIAQGGVMGQYRSVIVESCMMESSLCSSILLSNEGADTCGALLCSFSFYMQFSSPTSCPDGSFFFHSQRMTLWTRLLPSVCLCLHTNTMVHVGYMLPLFPQFFNSMQTVFQSGRLLSMMCYTLYIIIL